MSWELMIAVLVVTVGAAVYVAWPLLMGGTRVEEFLGSEPGEPVLQRLLFQRDTTYAAMKELEFDRAMGNLSQEDFDQIQQRYKKKAITLLRRIDDVKAGKISARQLAEEEEPDFETPSPAARRVPRGEADRIDLDLEQEIEAFRRRARGHTNGNGVTASARTAQSTQQATLTCPSCGRPVLDPDAQFCPKCGKSLRRRRKK